MTPLEVHLAAFDDAWSHDWESLSAVLAGVGEEEARWQAPAWRAQPREEGWPPEGSILWHVAHLAHCKRYYAGIVDARHEASAPESAPRRPLASLAAEREALRAAHEALRAAVTSVAEEDLPQPACGKMPLGEFLSMTVRHDAWHGAQIAVLRRLYRHRDTD